MGAMASMVSDNKLNGSIPRLLDNYIVETNQR